MEICGAENITSKGGDMDQAKKMDCSANGEVVLGVRDWLPGTLSDRSRMERILYSIFTPI